MQLKSPFAMNNASRDFSGWFGLHMDFLHQRVTMMMVRTPNNSGKCNNLDIFRQIC